MRLSLALVAAAVTLPALVQAQATPTILYVSPTGNDAWSGQLASPNATNTDGPKRSLDGARLRIRALRSANLLSSGGAEVRIYPGTYHWKSMLTFNVTDAGTPTGKIVYKAITPRSVKFEGGRMVQGWRAIQDSNVAYRLTSAARLKVLEVDLNANGAYNYGTLKRRGFFLPVVPAHMEMFVNDQPMTLAQWPNTGWATIASGLSTTSFTTTGEKPREWRDVNDTWTQGYFGKNFAETTEKVSGINVASGTVTTSTIHPYGLKAGGRFRLINSPEELDAPGEYWINRATGRAYLYPSGSLTGARTVVSELEDPMIYLFRTANLRFEGIVFKNSRGLGIRNDGSPNVEVVNCEFLNLGTRGISLEFASNNLVQSCDFKNLGYGAMYVYDNNRFLLTPSNNVIANNKIEKYGRLVHGDAAILVNGVGVHMVNNAIFDAPAYAIHLTGNDHVVEYNEIFDVCKETGDIAAVYYGRDFTFAGIKVRNNIFRNLESKQTWLLGSNGVSAVYMDDFGSGAVVENNVMINCHMMNLMGGGRDNLIRNNVAINCLRGWTADARGLTKDPTAIMPGGSIYNKLVAMNVSVAPWSVRYPLLSSYLADDLRVPKRNVIDRNLFINTTYPIFYVDSLIASQPNTVVNNVLNAAGSLQNPNNYDFTVVPGSSGALAGFQSIDAMDVGLQLDQWRTSRPSFRTPIP